MFNRMLVPLDGSAMAERALPFAAFLTKRSRGTLVLVSGIDEEQQRAMAEAALEGTSARLLVEDGIQADHFVVLADPSSAIAQAAVRFETDAIVMTTHGQSGGHTGFGSVAENALRIGGRPVLAIPPHCVSDWRPGFKGPVMVALDGSEGGEEALAPATALARLLETTVTIVQSVEPPASAILGLAPMGQGPVVDLQEWIEQGRPYGRSIAAELRQEGVTAATEILAGEPSVAIAQVAKQRQAAAIAMATRQRTGLDRAVLGSVAASTISQATVPVLLVARRD